MFVKFHFKLFMGKKNTFKQAFIMLLWMFNGCLDILQDKKNTFNS